MKVNELKNFINGNNESISLPCEFHGGFEQISRNLNAYERHAFLSLDLVGDVADIYLADECIYTSTGVKRELISLGDAYNRQLTIALGKRSTVVREASVFTAYSDVYIKPYGLFGSVTSLDEKCGVEVAVDVVNTLSQPVRCVIEVVIYNARNKKVATRKKRLTMKVGDNTIYLPLNIRRPIVSESGAGYGYTISAVVSTDEANYDKATCPFGIVRSLDKFNGITVDPNGGLFGGYCTMETELYRYGKLASEGYDLVKFTSVPADVTLLALSKLGMKCIVDIFDNWTQPRAGKSSYNHVNFKNDWAGITESSVRALRAHACVIMYSVGNALGESYGRGVGDYATKVVGVIKANDRNRAVTASLEELEPLDKELYMFDFPKYDMSSLTTEDRLRFASENDMFNVLTEKFVEGLDVVGVGNRTLDGVGGDKPVYYSAIDISCHHDLVREYESNPDIVGKIADGGADFLENGITDFDGIYNLANTGKQRDMITDKKNSYILCGQDMHSARKGYNGIDGEPINVYVHAHADVVQLSLDGKLVGRKLSGSVNDYVATFPTMYKAGQLQARLYAKGKEIGQCSLDADNDAYAVKVIRANKSKTEIIAEIKIVDREGDLCAIDKELTLLVEGGTLIKAGNGYSECGENIELYEGKALVYIKANKLAEKVVVLAKGDHVRQGRVTIKIQK